jgi:hypothetical protein
MIGRVDPGNAGTNDQHVEVLDCHAWLQGCQREKYERRRFLRQANAGFRRTGPTIPVADLMREIERAADGE